MTAPVNQSHIVLSQLPSLDHKEPLSLKEKQIIQVHILEKFADKSFLLFIGGKTFNAKSHLPLKKGQTILAKVDSLQPKLVLNFIDDKQGAVTKDRSDMEIKKVLSSINVIPSKKNLEVAKYLMNEHIPLKEKELTSFLKDLENLKLENKDDIALAAKLKKMSIPVKLEFFQKIKNIFNHNTAEKIPLKEFLNEAKQVIDTIKDPSIKDNLILKKMSQIIETLELKQKLLTISPNTESENISEKIQQTVSFAGESFEKKVLQKIASLMLDNSTKEFPVKNTIQDLEIIKKQIGNLPEQSLSINQIKIKKTVNNLLAILKDAEKTQVDSALEKNILSLNSQEKHGEINVAKTSFSVFNEKTFAKVIGTFDNLMKLRDVEIEQDQKLFKTPEVFSKEIFSKFEQRFRSFFDNMIEEFKQNSSTFLENKDLKMEDLKSNSLLDKTIQQDLSFLQNINRLKTILSENKYSNSASEGNENETSVNLKDSLLQLKKIIQGSDISNNMVKLEKQLNNMVNNISKEQILSLDDSNLDNQLKFNNLNLYLQDYETIKEMELFFKHQEKESKSGKTIDQFSVFFSMELSNLGYFEINVLDVDKKLSITFFSQSRKAREFFNQHKSELEQSLMTLTNKNVALKTAIQADETVINQSDKSNVSLIKNVIDILS